MSRLVSGVRVDASFQKNACLVGQSGSCLVAYRANGQCSADQQGQSANGADAVFTHAQKLQNITRWKTTYNGLSAENVTLVLTEVRDPRDVRKIVEQTSILTRAEDAVYIMCTQLFLEQTT